jgi:hypothetical protein
MQSINHTEFIVKPALLICSICGFFLPTFSQADVARQEVVAARGADVMPFSLKATTHVFTKTDQGGIQQVVAKDPKDAQQVRLTRGHLQEIAGQFAKGDFSGPSHIHGNEMPGLDELKHAKSGEIDIKYVAIDGGGQVSYSTTNPVLVGALHKWFDAQLSDHGADAMEGHHDHAHMHEHH